MDDDLGRIVLEGGGGGQRTESYELAMYFMARHTDIDCVNRRGRRGYLFIIGDEMPYPMVKPEEVRRVIGDNLAEPIRTESILAEPIRTEAIVAELTQMYDVSFILPAGASYAGDQQILSYWRRLLGPNVIELDDLASVSETIALTVGIGERAVSPDQAHRDLVEVFHRVRL
jgi:hypothetical protein